jgi:LmbE family N-acetylglucosaminyl deacetylase
MNVLAIGAHFDDVELGCGGALAMHVRQGDTVFVYVATVSGFADHYNRNVRDAGTALREAQAAMGVLGVKDLICGQFKTLNIEFEDALNVEIIKIVNERKIDLVYSHWSEDIHHDHKAVAQASLHSCRHVPRLLMYRSNWYHSTREFRGNFYVDITDTWTTKERAILAHESEVERTGRKWIKFFRSEAENAGQRIGVPMAEVFEIVKYLK